MKKTLTVLAGMICCVLMIAFSVMTADAVYYTTIIGDVNCDGPVNSSDLNIMRYALAGIKRGTIFDADAADIDCDGMLTMKDILLVRSAITGERNIFVEYGGYGNGAPVGRFNMCGAPLKDYEILVPENAGDCIDTFSNRMVEYLKSVTGVKVPIVTEDDGSPMIVITPDTEDLYDLGDEGYLIKTEKKRVYIYGGEKRGCMYGILDFLEKYCCVSYKVNRVDFEEYKRVTVETGIYDLWTPALEYRCVRISGYSGGSNLEYYVIPNKTNALESSTYLQSTRYGNGLGRTYANAHSFATLVESCTDNLQPCLTDEETYNECVDNLLALIEQREAFGYTVGDEMNQFSCSLNDNTYYCQCSKCMAEYREFNMSGALIKFVNRCAAEVKEEYPDIDVFTIAYYTFRIPPKNVVPADNLIICYCWNGCNNHYFGSGECNTERHYQIDYNNNNEEEYYLGWAELTDRLYVWYYSTNFNYYMAPTPNVYNIWYDFRWLYEHGVCGIFSEGSGNNTFEDLKGYLSAKMEENPLMTYEEYLELMSEFLEYKYGPGYEYILQYIDMQTEAADEMGCFVNNYEMPFDVYSRKYMAEHYEEMEALFDNAYKLAKTASQRNAIRKSSTHMYFLCLSARYESHYLNGTAEQKKQWENDYKNKLYKYTKDTGAGLGGSFSTFPPTNEIKASPMQMWYDDPTGSRGTN